MHTTKRNVISGDEITKSNRQIQVAGATCAGRRIFLETKT
jgi:hypothetical protein